MKNKIFKLKKNAFLYYAFLGLSIACVLLLSSYFLPIYTNGDQFYYRKLYDGLYGLPISVGSFDYYKNQIGSAEPVYYLVVWASSNFGVSKDILIATLNLFFCYSFYRVLFRCGANPFIIFLLLSFNYYSYVFYFSSERLKIALIFLALAAIYKKKVWVFTLLSLLCHSQLIIAYLAYYLHFLKVLLLNVLSKKTISINVIVSFFLFLGVCVVLYYAISEHVVSKFQGYYKENSLLELSKILVFMLLSLLYTKDRFNVVVAFLPVFISAFLVGGERVNFIGYFLFLYFSLHYRSGFNFGVIATLLYFLYKGILFLDDIVHYGTGYP